MTRQDIPAGLRLTRASRWNQLESDWSLFLDLNPGSCRIAEKDGQAVGTVATLRFQDRFSWLAMILVDPQARRQGIGTRLLREGLDLLSGERCVKLDATPAGRRLYIEHGFQDEYALSRMTRPAGKLAVETAAARRVTEGDLASIFERDREVFGADRSELLRALFRNAPQLAWVAHDVALDKVDQAELSYCFGRPGFRYQQIGPIVASNEQQAGRLLSHCLKHVDAACVVDAPQRPAWINSLNALGFSEERTFVRMYRGNNGYPGVPERVYGTLGPEFG